MVRLGGSRVDPRWRSGRSPATPDRLFRAGTYPTLSHSATQLSSFVPQNLSRVRSRTCFPCKSAGSCVGRRCRTGRLANAGRRATRAPAPRIAVRWPPSVRSCDASRPRPHPPLPPPDRRPARRLRRRRRRRRTPIPPAPCPAGTSIYLEGVVRPEGDQRDDVLDAAGKVLRTDDPERKVHELIDKGLKESDGPAMTYKDDIAPWLGEKAGVWVAGVDRDEAGLRRARRHQGHREGAGGDRRRASRRTAARSRSAPTRTSTTRSTRTAWRPASSATSSPSAPRRSSSARSRPTTATRSPTTSASRARSTRSTTTVSGCSTSTSSRSSSRR